ncbi:hypothetical protein JD78_02724 [Modestobacter roseus]|uniref:Dolichyl-phosphate-mannose-protein mannosyltransferase n=1 Tax=Modestobacter roseus TaxID=1181884 RepID=A0A562IT35_9ACTN|nr:hypothetical protein JD78_02724 [Modestobacter roseus]
MVFLLVRGSLIDDAYITLSYARNLAEHLHWGLTEGRTANSATSPLNVLVLGAGAFVVRDPIWGLGLVFVLLTAAQGWGMSRLAEAARLGTVTVVLGVGMVLLSPLMLSVVGMEMALAAALLVWLTVAALDDRPALFGVLTALLVLTRLDLGVFPLVMLIAIGTMRRRAVRIVLVAAATAAPWFVFSWVALGALVPDTLVIKTVASAGWGPWEFGNGPRLYLDAYPTATRVTTLPVLLGLVALLAWPITRAWRRPRWTGLAPVAALGLGGVLHYAAYSLLAPPPYHWYYAPSVIALTVVAAVAAGTARRAGPRPGSSPESAHRATVPAKVWALAGALVLVLDVGYAAQRPVPWTQVPIMTNWATAEQYQEVGEALADRIGDEVVSSPGEIGTLAYYCRCDIVDLFSDRGTLQPFIDQREREAGPVMRRLLQLNFANLERQPAAEPTQAVVWVGGPDAEAAPWPVESNWRGPGAFDLVPVAP